MRRLVGQLTALLLTGTALVACGEDDDEGTIASGSSSYGNAEGDVRGSWELVAGRGPGGELELVDGYPVTLNVRDTELGGRSACNHYGADMARNGDHVSVDYPESHAEGCRDDVTTLETAYHEALSAVSSISRTDDDLILTGPDVELRFTELPPVPTADIVGTTWVLESLIDGETTSSVGGNPATLTLTADGTLTGSTGCRKLTGAYGESTGEIHASTLAAKGDCSDDLWDQDAHVVEVIGDGFRATVDGNTLTLTSRGGLGLVYLDS